MSNCIYCIENKINGKKYIGKTCDFVKRKSSHKVTLNKNEHYNSHLQRSWNKYGAENFKFYIIENNISNKEINKKEIEYIKKYNTFEGKGYNLRKGGEGFEPGVNHPLYGTKRPKEVVEKIRKANTGKKLSEKTKRKLSKINTGKNHPMYGIKKSKEFIEKVSGKNHWLYGKHHTEETKELISKNKSGENHQFYGKRRKESFCKKMSKITKQQAIDIYYKYKNTNLTQAEIAEDYPITTRQVSAITRGNHYATRDLEGGDCY